MKLDSSLEVGNKNSYSFAKFIETKPLLSSFMFVVHVLFAVGLTG
jgi:hypothetical protein